jgi:hypothetical protein
MQGLINLFRKNTKLRNLDILNLYDCCIVSGGKKVPQLCKLNSLTQLNLSKNPGLFGFKRYKVEPKSTKCSIETYKVMFSDHNSLENFIHCFTGDKLRKLLIFESCIDTFDEY